MVSISWCCRKKGGIRLIEPNDNTAKAYIEMSSEALRVMNNELNNSLRWAISSCYYAMYYSLYAVLQKAGIKSEIHSCTIELMRFAFKEFYSKADYRLILLAFECRNSVQYYVDRVIDKLDSDKIIQNVSGFVVKSKAALSNLNQVHIKAIRNLIENEMADVKKY